MERAPRMNQFIRLQAVLFFVLVGASSGQTGIQAEIDSLKKLEIIKSEHEREVRSQTQKSKREAYRLGAERDKAFNKLMDDSMSKLSAKEYAALQQIRTTNQARIDSIYSTVIPELEKQLSEIEQEHNKIKNEISQLSIKRNRELASDSKKVNLYTKPRANWGWNERGGMYSAGVIYTSDVSLHPREDDSHETVGLSVNCFSYGNKSELSVWMYVAPAGFQSSNMSMGEYVWGDKGGEANQDHPSWYRWVSVTTDERAFEFGYTGAAAGGYMLFGESSDFIDVLLEDPDDKVQFYIHLFVFAEGGPRIFSIETTGFQGVYPLLKEGCK